MNVNNEEGSKKTTNNCCRGAGTFLGDDNVKLSDESLITKEGGDQLTNQMGLGKRQKVWEHWRMHAVHHLADVQ